MIEKSVWDYLPVKWLENYLVGHNGFIAGGCFKNIFSKEKVKDLDVFFRNNEDRLVALAYFESNKDYHKYYSNTKVDAFKNKDTGIVVELISTVYGTPKQIISNFDFTVTKFTLYKSKDEEGIETLKVFFHDQFFEHLQQKRTVIDNETLTHPASTFERMIKYTKYGFYPCRVTKQKIITSLQGVDVNSLAMSLYDGLD